MERLENTIINQEKLVRKSFLEVVTGLAMENFPAHLENNINLKSVISSLREKFPDVEAQKLKDLVVSSIMVNGSPPYIIYSDQPSNNSRQQVKNIIDLAFLNNNTNYQIIIDTSVIKSSAKFKSYEKSTKENENRWKLARNALICIIAGALVKIGLPQVLPTQLKALANYTLRNGDMSEKDFSQEELKLLSIRMGDKYRKSLNLKSELDQLEIKEIKTQNDIARIKLLKPLFIPGTSLELGSFSYYDYDPPNNNRLDGNIVTQRNLNRDLNSSFNLNTKDRLMFTLGEFYYEPIEVDGQFYWGIQDKYDFSTISQKQGSGVAPTPDFGRDLNRAKDFLKVNEPYTAFRTIVPYLGKPFDIKLKIPMQPEDIAKFQSGEYTKNTRIKRDWNN